MAQNLVPNGSFEDYINCPIDADNFSSVIQWNSPTAASPDYFNVCGLPNASIPNNIFGTQSALDGNGYAGFGLYAPPHGDYREYIQVQLTQMLLAGQKYSVSFNVSLADESQYAIKEIGAYFSATETNSSGTSILSYIPQIQFSDSVITDTIGWINIRGYFTAQGNEQYLVIGNFNDNSNTTATIVNNIQNRLCYYYIDEVSVTEISVPLEMPTAFTPNGDNKNDIYYPVFFDSILTIREFRIYNRWGQLIHDNPTIGWNGNYKGEPQPSDVYTYYIYADIPLPDNPNERATMRKQGSFTLLR
ncbi:MAG: gliding motility-associated C-terminal domain-containing protein [Chitinophagales bacterium]